MTARYDLTGLMGVLRQRKRLNLAHPGGANYLCSLLMPDVAGVERMSVFFRGLAPAIMAGCVNMMCGPAKNSVPHNRNRRIKAFAPTLTSRRMAGPAGSCGTGSDPQRWACCSGGRSQGCHTC